MKAAIAAMLLICFMGLMFGSVASAQGPNVDWCSGYETLLCPTGEAHAIIQTTDGHFVAAGWGRIYFDARPDDHLRIFVVKVDSTGDTLWTRSQEIDSLNLQAWTIEETHDGGFILGASGYIGLSPGGLGIRYLLKLNQSGEVVFLRNCGTSAYGWNPVVACAAGDDGYFLAGTGQSDSLVLLRTDADGVIIWQRSYYMAGTVDVRATTLSGEGDLTLVGSSGADAFMMQVDDSGSVQWSRCYRGLGYRSLFDVTATPDGYFVAAGADGNGITWNHALVIKTDSTGDTLWTRIFAGASPQRLKAVSVSADTGYVVAGSLSSIRYEFVDTCGLLMKLDPQGSTLWTQAYPCGDFGAGFGALDVIQAGDSSFVLAGGINWGLETSFALMKTEPDRSVPVSPQRAGEIPEHYRISAFPNPFNPVTTLSFTLPRAGTVRLAVHDLLGREVRRLTDEVFAAGAHAIRFDGADLPSGLYFATLRSGEFTATQKLLLLK